MHLPDFVLLIVVTGGAIAFGLAGAVLALAGHRFNAARGLFWLAAGLLGSAGVIWSQTTTEAYSLSLKMVVAAIVAAVAAAALVWCLNLVQTTERQVQGPVAPASSSEPDTPQPPANKMGNVSGNAGIVTQGQTGDNLK